ncbi:hypothetical protein KMW28_18600 [Flammeovirga yaeyamensis]|uniref:Uncharacterized protein n=1 Tax=Flammeovirga yaeyamensis TaxID=367791 RepID=A0AAX1N6X7_9BACT|nr:MULTISPECIES: hypothetical protein [Flammeovirga]ANQ50952.1 hypothetical protein MY04_3604 [Flammeovirga sp. MY04]MBB3701172.1 putative RNase H-like nuclease (RuvC/YqgF family) [Flammeovirga yaeyamensis]NMF38361.1 hypothetical protein [Flammeovirga yaeyamensis]QWG01638.1 hypothetical protein KMW28_18600 [Flammeovirga yaeyamensis]
MSKKDPHNPFEDILNDFVFPRMNDDAQKEKVKNTIKNVFDAVQGAMDDVKQKTDFVDVNVDEVKDEDGTENIHVEIKKKKKEKTETASDEVALLKDQIKILKSQLKDKDDIIELLKDKVEKLKKKKK